MKFNANMAAMTGRNCTKKRTPVKQAEQCFWYVRNLVKEPGKKSPGVSKSGVCLTSQFCTALNGTEQEKKKKKPNCVPLFPAHKLSCCLWTVVPICLCGSAATFYRAMFVQTSKCLCSASGLLKINLRCVARGCLGDASEREERQGGSEWITQGCKNLVDTSDSTVKWWGDVCSFSSSYYAVSVYASAFVS